VDCSRWTSGGWLSCPTARMGAVYEIAPIVSGFGVQRARLGAEVNFVSSVCGWEPNRLIMGGFSVQRARMGAEHRRWVIFVAAVYAQ
jgi:hypothetical protein